MSNVRTPQEYSAGHANRARHILLDAGADVVAKGGRTGGVL